VRSFGFNGGGYKGIEWHFLFKELKSFEVLLSLILSVFALYAVFFEGECGHGFK
jgi:hypothetical protein